MSRKKSVSVLPREFYTRRDVVRVAKELLGKVLYTRINSELTAGIIIETEAYAGETDMASHAYNKRRTARTEIMYKEGGTAYVYLCYGIHSLFNVVTSVKDDPQAVLIRGVEPLHGIEIMRKRSGKKMSESLNFTGPGNVTKLLGIQLMNTGTDLCTDDPGEREIWIQDECIKVLKKELITGPRVGIQYAKEDAFLPYRFRWDKKNKAPVQELYLK